MKAGALLAAALLAAACGSNAVRDPVDIDRVSFDMPAGANGNRPARLEMVRVDDDRLARELVRIATGDWFGPAGDAFRNANPDAVYDAWELVPGRAAGPFDVAARGDLAAVLFCDTRAQPPPLRLVRDGRVDIRVAADGCAVDGGRRGERLRDRLRRRRFVTVSFSTSADAGGHRPVRVELVRSPRSGHRRGTRAARSRDLVRGRRRRLPQDPPRRPLRPLGAGSRRHLRPVPLRRGPAHGRHPLLRRRRGAVAPGLAPGGRGAHRRRRLRPGPDAVAHRRAVLATPLTPRTRP